MPVEMRIRGLGQSAPSGAPLVLLKEATGERHLAIGIGPLELMGIAAALAETPPPRPLTHDLLCSALAACGATVTRAVIHALVDGVFHARLTLDVQGRPAELDARSSDAIAVAVRVGLPILVEEAVLEQAGITPPAEAGAAGRPPTSRRARSASARTSSAPSETSSAASTSTTSTARDRRANRGVVIRATGNRLSGGRTSLPRSWPARTRSGDRTARVE